MVGAPQPRSLALAALAAAALATALALGGVVDPDVGPGAGDASTPTPAATAAPVPTDATTPVPGVGGVPGVSESGVVDPAALAAHHDRTLEANYTLWMDLYWRSTADLTDEWHQRDVDVVVAGDRYHLRAEVDPAATAEPRRPVLSVYRDDETRYAAVYDADGVPDGRRLARGESSPSLLPEPSSLRSAGLARLLDTPLTTFSGPVERDGETFYRAVATGAPSGSLPAPERGPVPSTSVRNYSAVVLFDEAGRLASVEAWYTVVDRADPVAVRFQVTYDRRGRTTVTRPAWVDTADENATGT
jgi:hypothetical protein